MDHSPSPGRRVSRVSDRLCARLATLSGVAPSVSSSSWRVISGALLPPPLPRRTRYANVVPRTFHPDPSRRGSVTGSPFPRRHGADSTAARREDDRHRRRAEAPQLYVHLVEMRDRVSDDLDDETIAAGGSGRLEHLGQVLDARAQRATLFFRRVDSNDCGHREEPVYGDVRT